MDSNPRQINGKVDLGTEPKDSGRHPKEAIHWL
jgi:hypothetical protein